jgi:hypothetical protein
MGQFSLCLYPFADSPFESALEFTFFNISIHLLNLFPGTFYITFLFNMVLLKLILDIFFVLLTFFNNFIYLLFFIFFWFFDFFFDQFFLSTSPLNKIIFNIFYTFYLLSLSSQLIFDQLLLSYIAWLLLWARASACSFNFYCSWGLTVFNDLFFIYFIV